jgi:hypothetical protein
MKAFTLTFVPVDSTAEVTFSASEDEETNNVTLHLQGAQEAPVTLGAEDAAVLYTSLQYLFDTIRRRNRQNQAANGGESYGRPRAMQKGA